MKKTHWKPEDLDVECSWFSCTGDKEVWKVGKISNRFQPKRRIDFSWLTPQKSDIATHIYIYGHNLKGTTFSKPSFWVSMLVVGGVTKEFAHILFSFDLSQWTRTSVVIGDYTTQLYGIRIQHYIILVLCIRFTINQPVYDRTLDMFFHCSSIFIQQFIQSYEVFPQKSGDLNNSISLRRIYLKTVAPVTFVYLTILDPPVMYLGDICEKCRSIGGKQWCALGFHVQIQGSSWLVNRWFCHHWVFDENGAFNGLNHWILPFFPFKTGTEPVLRQKRSSVELIQFQRISGPGPSSTLNAPLDLSWMTV